MPLEVHQRATSFAHCTDPATSAPSHYSASDRFLSIFHFGEVLGEKSNFLKQRWIEARINCMVYIYIICSELEHIHMKNIQHTQTLRHLLRICNASAEILSMSDTWNILGFYFLPWLFPSLEKVGSTLYEMVSQNAEKFHLEDRKHGFLSCTLRVIRAPNPTIFPYEGLVKPPTSLLKCAGKFFVFSQSSWFWTNSWNRSCMV